MTLQARTLLMVTTLLVVAVLAMTTVLTWTNRQMMLAEAETQGVLLARLLALSAGFANDVAAEAENAVGGQMVVEATMIAHLVALAEGAGIAPATINSHLRAIARDTLLNELWITDEKGHAYLSNLPDVDFTFSPDPRKQPQAHEFWPLLGGETRTVVQGARQREVDTQVFKYVGVAGVDKPRIVQVGYEVGFLEALRNKVGMSRLVGELVAGRQVIAMRVVDNAMTTLVYGAAPDPRVPPALTEADKAELKTVMAERQTLSDLDGSVLKIMAPIMGNQGDRALAAAVVYVPADHVQAAVRRSLTQGGMVALAVLAAGLLASVFLARRVTGPVSRLTAAAAALESNAFEPDCLADVTRRPDELGHLARVFQRMALEVYAREQRLKQQVQQLCIEIDDARKVRDVAQITETEYFHDLCQRARSLRARFEDRQRGPGTGGAPSV